MSYTVTFTESSNPLKQPITVVDKSINNETSLTFVGKNYAGYAPYIANDFLHLLENFANTTSPANPVQGQLWFDNNENQLMVNLDGTENNWIPSGSVRKSTNKPSVASIGDIWVDTINQQLHIYSGSGSNWTLVGPQYSEGLLTGQVVETIVDGFNASHNIISLYSNNTRVAVISSDKFVPKSSLAGFSTIQQGITLINTDNSLHPGQTQTLHRFYGTATDADKLGGYSSSSYLRNDQNNVIGAGLQLSVNNINLGTDYNLNISTELNTNNYLISSNTSNNTVEIRLKNSVGSMNTIAFFDPTKKVGISTKYPVSTLDVNGTITASGTSGSLHVLGSGDVTGSASIQTAGGMTVDKSVIIGNNLTITSGIISVNNLDTGGNAISGPIILPTITESYDIGSQEYKFRNLYVQSFVGDVTGNVTGNIFGNVTGNVTGSAGYLSTAANISLIGDVSSNTVSYDGSQNTVTFTTTANQSIVSSQTELTDSSLADTLLIYREFAAEIIGHISGTTLTVGRLVYGSITAGMTVSGVGVTPGTIILSGSGSVWTVDTGQTVGTSLNPAIIKIGSSDLYNTSKETFLQTVPTVQIGSIILYPTSGTLPTGYLLCDGAQYRLADYPDLYYTLGASYLVSATYFTVPNLTGPVTGIKYIIFAGLQ